MPWKAFGKCVHKLNADGSKGKLVACHESEAKAKRQVQALYASENAKKAYDRSAFISIPLKLDGNLVALQERIKQQLSPEDIDFQIPETLHLTLIYMPDISDADLTDALNEFKMRPVELRGSQFAIFENISEDGIERALHLVVEPSEELRYLQEDLYYALDNRGVAMSEYSRPEQYKPHITLGYLDPGVEFSPFGFEYRRIAIELEVSRGEYNRVMHFVYRPESRDGAEIAAKSNGMRRALIITSNAYRDREREIIKEDALKAYVESSWDGDNFVGNNPLYVWHGGDPIGQIVYADMIGPFLLEVAQERPDTALNLAESGQPPVRTTVKSVWDALELTPDLRASHQFGFVLGDQKDGVYERIYKRESSVLPGTYPANWWTYFKVL
jgi:2'-5' RNA ligase